MSFEQAVAATMVADVQISPDGELVAYMTAPVSREGEYPTSEIWLAPSAGGPARRLVSSDGIDAFPRWSPDGRRIAFLSDREQRVVPQLHVLELASGETLRLTDCPAGAGCAAWSPDGGMLAFTVPTAEPRNEDERRAAAGDVRMVDADLLYASLWVIDVPESTHSDIDPPEPQRISPGQTHVGSIEGSNAFSWAPDGDALIAHLAVMSKVLDPASGWLARISLDGEVTHLCEASVVIGPPCVSPDGTTIAFNGADETAASPYALQIVPVSGGEPRLCLPGFEGSFLGFSWLPDGKLLAGANIFQRSEFVIVDPQAGESWPAFAPFDRPGSGAMLLSVTPDGRRAAFQRADARSHDVYVADLSTSSRQALGDVARRLTNLNPWLREASFGQLRDVAWTSNDGIEIQGLVALPVGYQPGKRYPTLVSIHGGPSETYSHSPHATWLDWAQFLAQRGYAVLLPNYRGSSGRGSEFLRSIAGRGGELGFQDIMSGVDWLVEQGIADPEQLVIGGWSYGGYLTAWTIAHTERFKTAIVGAGITNRVSFQGTTDLPSVDDAYLGSVATAAETLWQASPIREVGRVRTPTLILHGENDTRIPVSQGYELYRGLKSIGVETEMVVYPREGHFISERAHQLDLLRRVVGWYDRHLGRA